MHRSSKTIHLFFALAVAFHSPRDATAITVKGTAEVQTPNGQYMALTMTIDDEETIFELTGPDYSWFAFGFDTTSMMGYSLIVQGTDANRTVVEQNLVARGNPGIPQAVQNILHFDTNHDEPNNLTHLSILRANNTGDTDDPIFSPSMTSLDIIWAFSALASPEAPAPNMANHRQAGRGVAQIQFAEIPEPSCASLVALGASAIVVTKRQRRTAAHSLPLAGARVGWPCFSASANYRIGHGRAAPLGGRRANYWLNRQTEIMACRTQQSLENT